MHAVARFRHRRRRGRRRAVEVEVQPGAAERGDDGAVVVGGVERDVAGKELLQSPRRPHAVGRDHLRHALQEVLLGVRRLLHHHHALVHPPEPAGAPQPPAPFPALAPGAGLLLLLCLFPPVVVRRRRAALRGVEVEPWWWQARPARGRRGRATAASGVGPGRRPREDGPQLELRRRTEAVVAAGGDDDVEDDVARLRATRGRGREAGVPELGVVLPGGRGRAAREGEGAVPARDVVGRPVRGAGRRRRGFGGAGDRPGNGCLAPQPVEPGAHPRGTRRVWTAGEW